MSITTNQFLSTNVYGSFKVLDDPGILGTGVGAVPASFDISGNGIFRGSNIEFTNLPVSSAMPTLGTELITKDYGDATYTGSGILSNNNIFTGTNEFNTVPPQSTAIPDLGSDLCNKDYVDLKAPLASPTFTGTVSGIDKTMVGLGSVDNTSDANKPVSTATTTALNLKANLASPTFTGTVSGINKTMVGLANVDNTSDANKPVSTATTTALALKATLASNNTFTGTTNTFVDISASKLNDLIVKYDATTNTYATNTYPTMITTGYNNKVFGSDALTSVTTGYQNVAIGHEILQACDVGLSNIAVGVSIMTSLTDGETNTSVGLSNLNSLTSGNNNHVFGSSNAVSLTNGGSNIIVGSSNLTSATTGEENVCCGSSLLTGVVGGSKNTAVGFDALNAVTSGTHNIGIGSLTVGTGITSGNYNTFVGYNAKASGNYSNSTAIGANATSTASNQITLGNGADTVRCPNTASVVGLLTTGSATVTGALTAGSASITGDLTAGTATVTGALTVGSLVQAFISPNIRSWTVSPSKAETINRASAATGIASILSGTIYFTTIYLPAGMVINGMSACHAGGLTGSLQFCLFANAGTLLRNISVASASSTVIRRVGTFATSYTIPTSGFYFVGVLNTGGTATLIANNAGIFGLPINNASGGSLANTNSGSYAMGTTPANLPTTGLTAQPVVPYISVF